MKMRRNIKIINFFLVLFFLEVLSAELPENFVYIKDVIPNAQLEMRYNSHNNFIGRRINGYLKPKAILTEEAAQALKEVAAGLKQYGFGIKIFDAYRPQRAVDNFVKWAKDLDDTTMKSKYYPDVAKKDLFKKGYIAARSSHSRGSTVDLTIVSLQEDTVKELDMGSGFDYFSKTSWPISKEVTAEQRAHRLLLRLIMIKHGFVPYSREWWHFTYGKEPYPETYFDFPVE